MHLAPQSLGFIPCFSKIITPLHAPQRRVGGKDSTWTPKTLSETKFVYLKTKMDNKETVTNKTITVKRRYLITLFLETVFLPYK